MSPFFGRGAATGRKITNYLEIISSRIGRRLPLLGQSSGRCSRCQCTLHWLHAAHWTLHHAAHCTLAHYMTTCRTLNNTTRCTLHFRKCCTLSCSMHTAHWICTWTDFYVNCCILIAHTVDHPLWLILYQVSYKTWLKCSSMHQVKAKRTRLQLAEQWHGGLRRAVPGIQYMFGVRAFLPPNLHQIVPQDPGWTNRIYLVTICVLQKCPHPPLLFSDRIWKEAFGDFSLTTCRCPPGSFWSGPEFLFCCKAFLHSEKEASSGSWGGSKTVEMLS